MKELSFFVHIYNEKMNKTFSGLISTRFNFSAYSIATWPRKGQSTEIEPVIETNALENALRDI